MAKNLLDLLKDTGVFFLKSIDQGIYAHLQIDSEFLLKISYYKIRNLFWNSKKDVSQYER